MKIVIFGATGGTGRSVVEQALAEGHTVKAFDRNPAALTIEHPELTIVQGDVFKQEQVDAAVEGQDAVICVLGVGPRTTAPVCSTGTENIIKAMHKHGVKRLICQSAFAVAALDGEWTEVPWIVPLLAVTPKVRAMFADKIRQERFVKESNDLDWIIVRPVQLTEGPKTGEYTVKPHMLISPTAKVSRADVADFLLKQVSDDSHVHQTLMMKH